jgi:hypothetical protein
LGPTKSVTIYFVSFLAKPVTLEEDGATGAYVNCWIKRESAVVAQAQAEKDIRENGWRIEAIEQSVRAVEDKPKKEAGLEYFEQAQIDGEVYVYHTWSGPDEEPVH